MRPSIYQIYPIIALVVLAGATVWLERVTREDRPATAPETRQAPDITAEQTRLVSYDEHGRQRYELVAARVVNFPRSETTELIEPRLRYVSEGRNLNITARHALVSRRGEEVFMTGAVRALREAAPGSPAMSFASESLRVWPDEEKAETRDPVVLTQGAMTAHARGMRSDNLFGTLDLLGNVKMHMPRSPRKER